MKRWGYELQPPSHWVTLESLTYFSLTASTFAVNVFVLFFWGRFYSGDLLYHVQIYYSAIVGSSHLEELFERPQLMDKCRYLHSFFSKIRELKKKKYICRFFLREEHLEMNSFCFWSFVNLWISKSIRSVLMYEIGIEKNEYGIDFNLFV